MVLDLDIMNTYPDDDLLPDIQHRIFEDNNTNATDTFAEETSSFEHHPVEIAKETNIDSHESDPLLLLEKMGVSDPDCSKISGRTSTASALKKLISGPSPDIVLHRSSEAISEYNNPDLMPGMFPTLFPLGIAGFEHPSRRPKLSFQAHANALLDVPDKSFRHHQSFIFVALNIMQRRLSHLHTHFTVWKSNFESVASKLILLSPDTLTRLAKHLEQEGSLNTLTSDEKQGLSLLNHVNTISARIPGSQAAKIFTRNEIRSYFGEYGLPHLFFTFNPSVTHNPIFQVMVGDQSIDLTKRFPFVVPPKERAARVVADPVAAADFFEFCVTSVFEHLFGWNYNLRKSNDKGGILGHVKAFYSTSEFTERGSLHGHFLIWLLGGLNPNEIHERLKKDNDFEKRFFNFFEDIIQHELPEVDVNIDTGFEPRVERPPLPPSSAASSSEIPVKRLRDWQIFMESEVKKLGEVLQRHTCRPVCHKYGNVDNCRFLFPHEIEPLSYFDSETNSIILKCLDGMVNYFNRYILVYCRHNHDLKCILSGKAAKAAMCYITDYITKMDIKTYQMLSLLSCTVASVSQESELPIRKKGRDLLHKCLAQFTRQQQIHAQQAARYLRGNNDSISSHETIPMMSGLLLDFIHTEYRTITTVSDAEEEENDDVEHSFLKIQTDNNGKLVNHNQLTDYWYRGQSLIHLNFYDFVRCVSLQINKKNSESIQNETRFSIVIKHDLLPDHPLAQTHHLVQHTNQNVEQNCKQYVPRIVGSNIPHQTDCQQWKLFTLAHFKPFHLSQPLIASNSTIENTFDSYSFSTRSQFVMKNWEATHECEDKRDEERLRKRAAITSESLAMTKSVNHTSSIFQSDLSDFISPVKQTSQKDFFVLQTIQILEQSRWLTPCRNPTQRLCDNNSTSSLLPSSLPEPSASQIKNWMSSLKQQEKIIARERQTGHFSNEALPTDLINDTELPLKNPVEINISTPSSFCPSTSFRNIYDEHHENTSENIIDSVSKTYNLQSQQDIAFRIITQSFIQRYIYKIVKDDPLRMLLTGPGGTGKTHVVKAVQKVMDFYNAAHTIRFLAPTGSAASLIDGMTIHKGLGIKVTSSDKGKGNRKLGEHHEDYSVIISVQNKIKLRDEWRFVEVVMIDECSLLSAELLSEIDAALQFAKETPDKWFGNIIVIFAGDFYQYPPVCATALYNPIPSYGKTSSVQLARRLGRLAWKSINAVINFSDQKRMKDDPEYATAVTHLQTRECTFEDVDLLIPVS